MDGKELHDSIHRGSTSNASTEESVFLGQWKEDGNRHSAYYRIHPDSSDKVVLNQDGDLTELDSNDLLPESDKLSSEALNNLKEVLSLLGKN